MDKSPSHTKSRFPSWVIRTGVIIATLVILGICIRIVKNINKGMEEERYPEYFQAIAVIEADIEEVEMWLGTKYFFIPDKITDQSNYRKLIRACYNDYYTLYEDRLRYAELKYKKYNKDKTAEINIEKLAKRKPLEYLDLLWVIDSLAYDSLSKQLLPPVPSNISAFTDSISADAVKGVYLDDELLNYIDSLFPNNESIKLLREYNKR